MTSQIDPSLPVEGNPTTASVRSNFATAQTEITDLQSKTTGSPFLSLAGGTMSGPIQLAGDPTSPMMPATKGYVDAGGGGGGGGGIPEAPADANTYGRNNGAWVQVLALAGGALTGPLTLAADPTALLGAATRQYVDAGVATRLALAGGTLTGPLTLAADPAAALQPATKQYVDGAVAPLAPLAAPVFTGLVRNTGGRGTIEAASGNTELTLRNTGANLNFGIVLASNGLFYIAQVDASGAIIGATFFQITPAGLVTMQYGATIKGVTDGSSAPAGYIGEVVTAGGGPYVINSGQAGSPCSIALQPGDWDVTGFASVGATDGSTLATWWGGVVLDNPNTTANAQFAVNVGGFTGGQLSIGTGRINISTARTIYLNCQGQSNSGVSIQITGSLFCRRAR